MASGAHWDGVYERTAIDQVSWYQREPTQSLTLVAAAGTAPGDAVLDVGGGASVLVDRLLSRGHTDVTVLDIAADALAAARARLGPSAAEAHWVVGDLLAWDPPRRYRLWHDRAVFHFLTDRGARDRYRAVLAKALAPGGHVVIATFAADGPTSCSGLPVARYGPEELAAQFPDLRVITSAREEHVTPADRVQAFTWLLLAAS